MKLTDIPTKVDIAFASQAASGFIRVIPETPGTPGAASWTAGFPPQNMEPIAAGGIPPFGQDMNGVMNAISAWTRWQSAGATVQFDAGFSSSVGGYPTGALLAAANGQGFWLSTKDDNTTNPDTTPNGDWSFIPSLVSYAGNPNTHAAGSAATPSNAPTLIFDSTNLIWWYCSQSGNASSAQWKPFVIFTPVDLTATGSSHSYVAADNGQVLIRANGGSAMADTLPTVVAPGWNVTIINGDASALLTITPPGGKTIQGSAGTRTLRPGQNMTVAMDASGNFWITVPPVPVAFSGQAIYVNTSGTYAPGVYDIDTSAGPITFTLEAGGIQGDNYRINDVAGYFSINPCTVNGNGANIEDAATMPLDVDWTLTVLTLQSGTWKAV